MKKSNRNFEAIIAGAEKQFQAARMAWVNATTPAAKALAQKAGEKAKARIAEIQRGMAAETPVPAAVADPAADLKARYHKLRVDGEQKLEEEFRKEEAALKEKFSAKKAALLSELMAAYKAELAGGTVAEVPAPAADPQEVPAPEAEPQAAPAIVAEEAVEAKKEAKENLLFACDEVEAELPPTTSVSSPKAAETPSAAKKAPEVELTPEEEKLETIAAKALAEEGKKPSGLLHTGVSFEASGQKYEVVTVFDYFLFEAVGAVEKEVMIAAAVQGGAIKKAA